MSKVREASWARSVACCVLTKISFTVAKVVQVVLQLDDDLLAVCEQIAVQLP